MKKIVLGLLYIAQDFGHPLNKLEFRVSAILFLLGFGLLIMEIILNWPSNNIIECGTRTFFVCMLIAPYVYANGNTK